MYLQVTADAPSVVVVDRNCDLADRIEEDKSEVQNVTQVKHVHTVVL